MTILEEVVPYLTWSRVAVAFDRWDLAFAGALLLALWAFAHLQSKCSERRSMRHFVLRAGGIAVLAVGAFRVCATAFVCDDAFISFRYARNLASGHGLVWNVGERVEGYTNFLFTALLGGLARVGADIPLAALLLDASAYLGCIALAWLVVRDLRPHAAARGEWPVAATVLALARPMTTFATSGLETMVATFATLWLLLRTVRGASPTSLGALAGALAMIRPDHAVFAVGVAFAAACRGPGDHPPDGRTGLDVRRALRVLVVFGVVFGTYFVLRAVYYGDLVPNTFRAKSGGASYWSRGAVYGAHFVATTGAWLGLPLVVGAALHATRLGTSAALRPVRAFVWVGASLLTVYVLRVGGDFMEHRFLVTPFACLVVLGELEVRACLDGLAEHGRGRRWLAACGVVTTCVATLPIRPILPGEKALGIAAEETFYPLVRTSPTSLVPAYPLEVASGYEEWARRLSRAFEGQPRPPTVAYGSIGILGYRTGFPIVDVLGLTDRRIASRPLAQRGRPGHERLASLEDAAASGAEFWLDAPAERTHPAAQFTIAGISATLLSPSARTARALRAAGVDVDLVHGAIDEAAVDPSRAARLAILPFARLLATDAPRHAARLARLSASLGSVAEFDDARAVPAGARAVRWCDAAESPVGQGAGALALSARAFVEWPLPGGAEEVRLRAWASTTGAFRVEVVDASGRSHGVDLRSGPQMVTLRMAPASSGRVVLRVRGLGRHDARASIDAVHIPDPAELDVVHAFEAEAPDSRVARFLRLADELPLDDPRLVALRPLHALTVGFEPGAASWGVAEGDAFGVLHAARAAQQGAVVGAIGLGHLSGYVGGDGPQGRWRAPLGTSGPAVVMFRLAGGADCGRLRVELRAGESLLGVACGAGDERFRPHRFEVPHDTGRDLELTVVDASSDAYGHLMLDELVVLPYEVQALDAAPSGR